MSCCPGVKNDAVNPWNTRAVVATAVVAAATLVVCALLAILVSQNVITMPSQLSVTNLLIAGIVGAVCFGLVSLVIKYCCCRLKKEKEGAGNNENEGTSFLHKDGEGKTGAKGEGNGKETHTVKKGERKNVLND